jgi:lipopolysaccharide exporter
VRLPKLVNVRGDLFATTFAFGLQGIIRLGSSLVLTRVLLPEAYGIITILVSILYIISNIIDTNVTLFIVRDKNAELPRYLNTAWTMRFIRSTLSGLFLFAFAPLIASKIYDLPSVAWPLRVFSLWFFLEAFESMSFPLSVRRKQARLQIYSDLFSTAVSTAFSVVYCYIYHTFWGMAFGMLLNRLIMTILSFQFYKELRPRFLIDKAAAREVLSFSKYTVPSSFLSLGLNQFDKVGILRLFDLRLLGFYGLASNIASSIEQVIIKISQSVLYPRCAQMFREDPTSATRRFYTENTKLFACILGMPAVVIGCAQFLISLLYNSTYSQVGGILQALAVRALIQAFISGSEDLLISAGEFHVILVGNILRAIWIVPASLIGYHFGGFLGFVYGLALIGLPPLVYNLWLQNRKGLLIVRYEFYKLGFAIAVAVLAFVGSELLMTLFPGFRIRH